MIEFITPKGRLVKGHPMKPRPVTRRDPATGQEVKVMRDNPHQPGQQVQATEFFCAFAIPKNGTTDWRSTEWGAQIAQQAQADWPNGEHAMPAFSWKIIDGDSQAPNKKMKKPCDQEGYPGNWVIMLSTRIAFGSFRNPNYSPMDALQDENEIKTGDYGRFKITCKGNGAKGDNTPGMYLNPVLFSLDEPGEAILSDTQHDATDAFGGGGAAMAPTATTQQATHTPPPPATDIVDGPPPPPPGGAATAPMWIYNGKAHPREYFQGWTDAQVNDLPRA